MVFINLEIKATLENISELYTNHPDYTFLIKYKCTSCGEVSNKWHDIIESETVAGKIKSEVHFAAKCKLCGRENTLEIVAGSNGKYLGEDQGKFKSIVTFECRGMEPIEFKPTEGWIGKVEESGTIFSNVDFSEDDWADYDEKTKNTVGVYEFCSRFVTRK